MRISQVPNTAWQTTRSNAAVGEGEVGACVRPVTFRRPAVVSSS
ncbi:hypothetical protein [Microbispora sp. GKU 823]|nr:hypothetical protein [Microbispora sp. GKU 823]